ncbi:hypothetical protein [Haloarcula marina]|nr:hypothetical protein [Halomicroarcula marina]
MRAHPADDANLDIDPDADVGAAALSHDERKTAALHAVEQVALALARNRQ